MSSVAGHALVTATNAPGPGDAPTTPGQAPVDCTEPTLKKIRTLAADDDGIDDNIWSEIVHRNATTEVGQDAFSTMGGHREIAR